MGKTFRRKEFELDEAIGKYRQRKDERQGHNSYYAYKKRKAERNKMREDARWITIGATPGDERRGMPASKGRHVLIDDEGMVVSGAGGSLTGVTLTKAESTSGEVSVDPAKTSDPKPESPAGEAGKSSAEVASEAKEAEATGTTSVEPGESFIEKGIKAAKDNDGEAWKDFLKNAPDGTEIDANKLTFTKENGEWICKHKMSGDEVGIDPGFFGDDLQYYIKSGRLKGLIDGQTGEILFFENTEGEESEDPGESSTEVAAESGAKTSEEIKLDIETLKEAVKNEDTDAFDQWLENAPVGTTLDFGTSKYKKTGENEWQDEKLDTHEIIDLEQDFYYGDDFAVIDPKTEERTVLKGFEKPAGEAEGSKKTSKWSGEDFGMVYKDAGLVSIWMKKAPEKTVLFFQDKDGKGLETLYKTEEGKWKQLYGEDFADEDAAVEWLKNNTSDATKWVVLDHAASKGYSGEYTGIESFSDEPEEKISTTSELKDIFKKTDTKEIENDLSEWMKHAPVGSMLSGIYENESGEYEAFFTKEDDGWHFTSEEDPDEVGVYSDEEAASGFMEGLEGMKYWGAKTYDDDETSEEYKGSKAKKIDKDTFLKENDFGNALKNKDALKEWAAKVPDDTLLTLHDADGKEIARFTKLDEGGWMMQVHGVGVEGVSDEDFINKLEDKLTDAKSWGTSYSKIGFSNGETTGFYAKKVEDVDYKPKTDLESALTAHDKETVAEHLKKLKAGSTVELSTSTRYIKGDDGKWKKQRKDYLSSDWKDSYGGFDEQAVAFAMSQYAEPILNGKKLNVIRHAANSYLKKLKENKDSGYNKELIGISNKDFSCDLKNFDGEKVNVVKQDDGTFRVKEGDKTQVLNEKELLNYIKSKDLWISSKVAEADWIAHSQNMLKKHLAPLKKSLFTAPDEKEFEQVLSDMKDYSTFQMRNTDGTGISVRKIQDNLSSNSGFIVKTFDKDGKIKDVESYSIKEAPEMFNKLSSAAKKGVTFNNQKDITPYVPEVKKSAYKGPADSTSYATTEKSSAGLSKISYDEKAYSDAARKAAIDEAGTDAGKKKVHDKLAPGMKKWWKGLSEDQKSHIIDYTGSYHDTNEPLRGFTYTSYTKGDPHINKKIEAIDKALDESTLEEPLVVSRGISLGTFRAMVDHKSSSYSKYAYGSTYGDELVGKEITEPSYMSCTAAGKADFGGKAVQLKIYLPAGTKGAYINPVSQYGMKLSDPENDTYISPSAGPEFEFLLQRGCKFKVRGIKKDAHGKLHVDLDLIEQNPRELTVSGKKGIYADGKDAYDF